MKPTEEPPVPRSRVRQRLIYIGIGILGLWLLVYLLANLSPEPTLTPDEEAQATQESGWATATSNMRATNAAQRASLTSADETATAVADATAHPTVVARAVATLQAMSAATAAAQLEMNRDALARAYMESQSCEDILLEYRTRINSYTTGNTLSTEEAHDLTLLQLASSFGTGTSIPIQIRDISTRVIQCQANQEG